jgi:2-(1,2-epoxy-1,2-dihydrophenyl)acetyl-CoA isomerase
MTRTDAGPGAETSVVIRWDDDVLVVIMNRPHVANAFNPDLLRGLSDACVEAASDRCGAVVLTGAGRNFCAGADIKEFQRDSAAMQLRTAFHPPLCALAALQKPVIAALNGAVAGGGMGFALAADIRIMGASARLVPAWVEIGLGPDLGASWFLPRLIGLGHAYEWLVSGEPMSAQRAVALGLASEVVDDDALLDHVVARAKRLAAKPRLALAFTKRLLIDGYGRSFHEQIDAEAACQELAGAAQARGAKVAARIAQLQRTDIKGI